MAIFTCERRSRVCDKKKQKPYVRTVLYPFRVNADFLIMLNSHFVRRANFPLLACADLVFIYRSQTVALHTSTRSLRKIFTSIVDVFALNSNEENQILALAKPRDVFYQNFCFTITRFKDKIRFC